MLIDKYSIIRGLSKQNKHVLQAHPLCEFPLIDVPIPISWNKHYKIKTMRADRHRKLSENKFLKYNTLDTYTNTATYISTLPLSNIAYGNQNYVPMFIVNTYGTTPIVSRKNLYYKYERFGKRINE